MLWNALAPNGSARNQVRRARAALGILSPALLLAWSCGPDEATPRPLVGLVDATEIDVASKVPGRVLAIQVREGDRVQRGTPLASIESEDIEAKLAQVSAGIDAAKARLRMAQNGARAEQREATRNKVEAARHQLEVAKKMYDRLQALRREDAVPQAQFDEAEFRYNLARDQLAMAEAELQLVLKGPRSEEIAALQALVRKGEGTLAEVASYKKEAVQSAPITGEVSKVILHPGELAATGHPIITLVDIDHPWAAFAVREDLLRQVRVGETIQLEIPAIGRNASFQVYAIAALGDFATWRATSEKAGFDLKSFEVKARPQSPIAGLRPGMTVRWALVSR